MSQFFSQLQQSTAAAQGYLLGAPAIERGVEGDISRASYLAYLAQAYHHVKHTTPLLMACGSRLPGAKEWLRDAIAEYIEEELGHQEWILNDIEAAGGDARAVRHAQPHKSTELMVSYAYDSIQRGNPCSFFGMVYVLEGTSIKLATQAADSIQKALDLPNEAFSYLRSHGSLDLQHMEFFEELMNRIEDPEDQHAIQHMAEMMFHLYGNVFRALPLD